MAEPGTDIIRYGDAAMYEAQPILREEGSRVMPRVFLQSATPDPLGAIAAGMRMYRGDPPYTLDQVTDEERRWAWEEIMKSHLNSPLEFVDLQFMIEAVTRAWTHQAVRQRVGAVFAQESLRFAVKKGLASETALPPSIMTEEEAVEANRVKKHGERVVASDIWHQTVKQIERAYESLLNTGIPAEDARGLLPHATTTRLIYKTNLRGLFEHAGNRLCTQAQFEWRAVFMGIMKAIRDNASTYWHPHDSLGIHPRDGSWQWELIAQPRPQSFTPVCYRLNRCPFMSKLDRGCTIRDRVQAFAAAGVPGDEWHSEQRGETVQGGKFHIAGIRPEEWMANPWAGITHTEADRPQ